MTPYEAFQQGVANDYELLASNLTSRYLATQAAVGQNAPALALQSFRPFARHFVSEFIKRSDGRINDYVSTVADGYDVQQRSDALKQSLRVIAIKNAQDLTTRLTVGNTGLKTLFNRPMGAIGLVMQRRVQDVDLKSEDSSGRMWDSKKLVKTLARDFAYQTYIDVQVAELTQAGVKEARVVHPDEEHRFYGATIELDKLADVRGTIFHPNSQAELAHV